MKKLTNSSALFVLVTLTVAMFAPAAQGADPSDEAKNKESCTGTCSTCPGKATALTDLADKTKVLLATGFIESAEVVKQIRTTISELEGVEACVPFKDEGWVWVAFDTANVSSEMLQAKLKGLGLTGVAEIQYMPALGALPKNHERAAIYVMIPTNAKSQTLALGAISGISGVANVVYDRAYHLLLFDFDATKTHAKKLKQEIVAAGYAAGLPGEDLTQPEPY